MKYEFKAGDRVTLNRRIRHDLPVGTLGFIGNILRDMVFVYWKETPSHNGYYYKDRFTLVESKQEMLKQSTKSIQQQVKDMLQEKKDRLEDLKKNQYEARLSLNSITNEIVETRSDIYRLEGMLEE